MQPGFALCRTSPNGARLAFIQAACAVAEGATVVGTGTAADAAAPALAAALADPLRRVCVMGGRQGLLRSLGSVYAGSVVRFLGGFRGVASRVIPTPGVVSWCNGVAVTRDGCTLLVTDTFGGSHAIHTYCVRTGLPSGVVGSAGEGPLQFRMPCQICVAEDGAVFVADASNDRIQVLTPQLDFHGLIGVGQIHCPSGVCANSDVVATSERLMDCISVFGRRDGALLRRVASSGRNDGEVDMPLGLCFLSGNTHIAFADCDNRRVSVFSVDGAFVRHVGKSKDPVGVACCTAAHGELVVASDREIVVWSADNETLHTISCGDFQAIGVAIHGDTVFATTYGSHACIVLT